MTPEVTLTPWTDTIDPATIPDQVLWSELGRRRAEKRHTKSGGRNGSRPLIVRRCPVCKEKFSAREYRSHVPQCRREAKAKARANNVTVPAELAAGLTKAQVKALANLSREQLEAVRASQGQTA